MTMLYNIKYSFKSDILLYLIYLVPAFTNTRYGNCDNIYSRMKKAKMKSKEMNLIYNPYLSFYYKKSNYELDGQ